MRKFITALLATMTFVMVVPAFAVDPTELEDPVLQERYKNLTQELRCLMCQSNTLADSPSQSSEDLRRQVREMLVAGKTDQEIRDYMVERYGEFILFRPPFSGRTAWLWIAPGVLLLIGAIVAVRIVRHRSQLVDADDEPLDEDSADDSPVQGSTHNR